MKKKPKSKVALKREKLRSVVEVKAKNLFRGVKPEDMMRLVKDAIANINRDGAMRILKPCFHRLIGKSTANNWSMGYCHCIAQVAAIVLGSDSCPVEVFVGAAGKKKVSKEYRCHFVLRLKDGSYFDPVAEPHRILGFPKNYYEEKGFQEYRLPSQWWYPSNSALRLMYVFIEHCRGKNVFGQNQKIIAEELLACLKRYGPSGC